MKKILTFLVISMFVFVSTGFALPWDSLSSDWTVSGAMDYWTPTDLTSSADGDSFFEITMEKASYESAFGLYTIDANGHVDKTFQVFAPQANPATTLTDGVNVNFWNDNGNWKITSSYYDDSDNTNDNWVSFDRTFGFYYSVDMDFNSTGHFDPDYTFYTDNSLNTAEAGTEHIMTAYNYDTNWLKIYLDDQIEENVTNPDGDFNDMTVIVNDIAPVPEPATLLLLGSGLVGLAFLKRRKA